jgi:arylsulfatase A-like enzyme
VYRLAENQLFAHRDQRGALLFMGGPESSKATRGEEFSLGAEVAGEPAARFLKGKATLSLFLLPGTNTEALHLRVYSPQKGVLRASIAGETLGKAPLQRGWQEISLPVERAISPGLVAVQVALDVKGGALSWVHLGARKISLGELGPLVREVREFGAARVALAAPGEGALSYLLLPPEDAEFEAWLATPGPGACQVSVQAQTDGTQERALFHLTIAPGAFWQKVRAPLDEFAGQVTRLSLTSQGCEGPVYWGDAALITPGAAPTKPARTMSRVIVWVIDTQRADAYSFYNPETRIHTPNMNRLAERSTVFEACYSAGNESQASGASLLTSTYPAVHGFFQERGDGLAYQFTSLAEAFAEAGWRTAGFSANGYISKRWQFEQGFEVFSNHLHEGRGDDADRLWERGRDFLEKHADEPVFLYLQTVEPHVPYDAHPGLIEKYEQGYEGRYPRSVTGHETQAIRDGSLELSPEERAHIRALYDNEVEKNDLHLGEMLDFLDARGWSGDTLVLITADHGEEMFEHGERRIGHGRSLFQGAIWIPLIIHAPGLYPSGGRVAPEVEHVDLMPSLLEAAGIEIPEQAQGRSLWSLAHDPGPYPQAAITSWFAERYAVTMGRFKWVGEPGKPGVLYDLRRDPNEENDVSEAQPLTAQLLREIFAFYHPRERHWKKSRWGLPSNHRAALVEESAFVASKARAKKAEEP